MKKETQNTLVYDFIGTAFCLVMAFVLILMFSGCSNEDSKPSVVSMGGAEEETGFAAVPKSTTIIGRALRVSSNTADGTVSIGSQVPQGHVVRMTELDSATFDTTDNKYFSSATDRSGVFSFDSVNLGSAYVLLELSPSNSNWWTRVDDFIKEMDDKDKEELMQELGETDLTDWVSSIMSNDDLIFIYSAIVNLQNTEDVAINVMTYLESSRWQYLVKQGKGIEEAKEQADREVMDAFGFYDVPFQFGSNEYASSEAGMEIIRFVSIHIGMSSACIDKPKLDIFRTSGSFANLPDTVKAKCNIFPASVLWAERYFIDDKTMEISDKDRNMYGNFLSSIHNIGKCTDEKEGDTLVITYLGPELDLKLKCKSKNWSASAFRTVREDMPRTEGTMTDPRDGKTYRTVTYETDGGTQTWMMDNLTYSNENITAVLDSEYVDSLKALHESQFDYELKRRDPDGDSLHWIDSLRSISHDWYLWLDSTYLSSYVEYKWFDALGLDSALVYTDSNTINSEKVFSIMDSVEATNGYYQGLCPDGWRIPKVEDWTNLIKQIYRNLGDIVENKNKNWKTGTYDLPQIGFGPITTEHFILRPEAENEDVWFPEENIFVLSFLYNLKTEWVGANQLNTERFQGKVNIRCIKN